MYKFAVLVFLVALDVLASDSAVADQGAIQAGDVRNAVIEALGEPRGSAMLGRTEILYYPYIEIELQGGKVVSQKAIKPKQAKLDADTYRSFNNQISLTLRKERQAELSTGVQDYVGPYLEENNRIRVDLVIHGKRRTVHFRRVEDGLAMDDTHPIDTGAAQHYGTILFNSARYAQLAGKQGDTAEITDGVQALKNAGGNIFLSLFARSLKNPLDPQTYWPRKGSDSARHEFPTSTAFFEYARKDGVIDGPHPLSFFGINKPGVPADWCIVAGVDFDTQDGVPVLFTANLDVESTEDLKGPLFENVVDDGSSALADGHVVVVLHGGAVRVLTPDQLKRPGREVFVLPEEPLKVLRP